MDRKKSKAWRIVGIALLALVAIAGSVSIWFSANYKSVLKRKIPIWVAKATDSVYQVSVEDISISLVNRDATIRGLRLWVDSSRIQNLPEKSRPATVLELTIPMAEIEGIRWADLATDRELVCGKIRLQAPKIDIHSISKPLDSTERKALDSLQARDPKKQPKIDHIHADEILVNDPDVYFNLKDSARNLHYYAKGGNIKLYDWDMEADKMKEQRSGFFFAQRAEINIDSFLHKRDSGRYHFRANTISFSTAERSFNCKDLTIKSPYSKEEFFKIVGRQADMFDIHFAGVNVRGLDWERLLDSNQVIVEEIELDRPRAEDYFTRLAPPNTLSKLGNFPNQILLKVPIGLYVPVIKLKDGFVQYAEVNEKSKKPGTIAFDHTTGTIENATNIPAYIQKDGDCRIKLHSNFNGGSDLTSIYKFSLRDSSGKFSAESKLKDLEAGQIRSMARALMLINIDSLKVSSLHFKVEGDETYAKGTATLIYRNLKVSLLEPEKEGVETKLDKKEVTSWIANGIFVKNSNPSFGEAIQVSSEYVKRDPYKSFFNLLWTPTYTGIVNTIIRGEAIEKAILDRNKKDKRPGFLRKIFGGKKKDKK